MNYYRQVIINKGSKHITAWIPEEFAISGKIIKIKEDDSWEDGWKINRIFGRKSQESLNILDDTDREFRRTLAE